MKNYHQAIKYNIMAFRYYSRLKNKELTADIYNNIGSLLLTVGKLKWAKHFLNLSLMHASNNRPEWKKVFTENELAKYYYLTGDYNNSREHAEIALNYLDSTSYKKEKTRSMELIGDAYFGQKKYNQAIEQYKKAINTFSNDQTNKIWQQLMGKIALTYNRLGDNEKAKQFYLEALDLYI